MLSEAAMLALNMNLFNYCDKEISCRLPSSMLSDHDMTMIEENEIENRWSGIGTNREPCI